MTTDVITLIKAVEAPNEYGDLITTETAHDVFAEVLSVGQAEFYQAQAVGLQPSVKFVLADYLDYQDEKILEHDGRRYRVLRTYRTGNKLELTVYQEVNPA